MKTIFFSIFAIVTIFLLFLPAGLLVMASFRLSRITKHFSIIFIVAGGILLSIASLDFLISIFTALNYNSESLAQYSIYSSYIVGGLRYIGLLRITKNFTHRAEGEFF